MSTSSSGTCDWARREALLDAVLDLPLEQRGAFLDKLAQQDAGDAEVVAAWLRGVEESDGHWIEAATDGATGRAGEVVGNWRALRLLGRGGMGEVWLGERADGLFDKQVAIKFIRDERPALREGIEAERRLLAALRHPGIVRLLDAGLTVSGQPYLVTDYIEGMRLDEWLRSHQPGLPARLDLLRQIASALAHAHEQLVVHRDIKPGNVLVDAAGRTHLLDFGIARALDHEDGEAGSQRAMMTPEFAAPESLDGSRVGVRADIHGLGALLYFLLCEKPPLALRDLPLSAVHERIRTQAPAPLLERMPASLRTGASSHWLADLEAIALKAMAKDPADRYGSVEAMLGDLKAAGEQRSITARSLGPAARAWRFVYRNRLAIGIGVVLLASLLAGLAGTLWQARQAAQQRDLAAAAAMRAEAERGAAVAVRDFMVGVFSAANPEHVQGELPDAAQLLASGVRRIEGDLADKPAQQAELFTALGDSYAGLGEYARAVELTRRAYELALAAWGEDDARSRRTLARLAYATLQLGGPFDALRGQLERSLAYPLPLDESDRIAFAEVRANLGGVLFRVGQLPEAERVLAQAVAEARALGASGETALITALHQRTMLDDASGHREQAIAGLHELTALLERQPVGSVANRQVALQNLATLLGQAGRGDEAEQILIKLRDANSAMYGASHPATIASNVQLGRALLRRGQNAQARSLLEQMLALAVRAHGEDSESAAFARINLAALELAEDRHAVAIGLIEAVYRHAVAHDGVHGPRALMMLQNLARTRIDAGDLAGAERDLQALEHALDASGSPPMAEPLALQGTLARLRGQPAQARALHRQALDMLAQRGDTSSLDVQDYRLLLAEDARDLGEFDVARAHVQDALKGLAALDPSSTASQSGGAHYLLAQLDVLQGRCSASAHDALATYRTQLLAPFTHVEPPAAARLRVATVDLYQARCRVLLEPGDAQARRGAQALARRMLAMPGAEAHALRLARTMLAGSGAS
ncbi:protein kinase domain-containing protein [Luteimonas sp. e5]